MLKQTKTSKGKMSREDAGRLGGEATLEKYGPEFFEDIGREGGEAVSQDREHMRRIGRKGGQSKGPTSQT